MNTIKISKKQWEWVGKKTGWFKFADGEEKSLFTPAEISEIDKKLSFIVFDWAKHLVIHILNSAKNSGVQTVYMNTSKTLHGSNTELKVDFFYEKLPQLLGFQKKRAKLRGKYETFWAYDLATNAKLIKNIVKLAQQSFELSDIPSRYQGAIISIIGRKQNYTIDEIQKVYEIVNKTRAANLRQNFSMIGKKLGLVDKGLWKTQNLHNQTKS